MDSCLELVSEEYLTNQSRNASRYLMAMGHFVYPFWAKAVAMHLS